ncbi:MAG: response regulator, partial [Calditrichaeota bacterium]|nr:response regulator [Calditrichota bacterium]
ERILLVDDEVPLVKVGQQILSQLGYQVTAETRSTAALATFSADPRQFDLLITDHTMPDMTGIELAQKVLAIRPELPVILVSGFSEIGTQEQARQLGVRDFLTKPVPTRDLVQAIRRIFDKTPRQRLRKVVG